MSKETRSPEPHDRLTRLCDAMIKTLENHPEEDGDEKCIIFIQDQKRGGIVLHGYEQDSEAIADLFIHIRAIFRSNGKDLQLHPLNIG